MVECSNKSQPNPVLWPYMRYSLHHCNCFTSYLAKEEGKKSADNLKFCLLRHRQNHLASSLLMSVYPPLRWNRREQLGVLPPFLTSPSSNEKSRPIWENLNVLCFDSFVWDVSAFAPGIFHKKKCWRIARSEFSTHAHHAHSHRRYDLSSSTSSPPFISKSRRYHRRRQESVTLSSLWASHVKTRRGNLHFNLLARLPTAIERPPPSVVLFSQSLELYWWGIKMGDYNTPGQRTMEITLPKGHIIPPEGCIILPEGCRRPQVEAGGIMWPEGSLFSIGLRAGVW